MDHSYRASRYVREVLAKFLDRITDRILPEDANQSASRPTKYLATGAGLIVWTVYGYLFETREIEMATLEGRFDQLPAVWSYNLWLPTTIIAISMLFLIGNSFIRGQPLTFFFFGV